MATTKRPFAACGSRRTSLRLGLDYRTGANMHYHGCSGAAEGGQQVSVQLKIYSEHTFHSFVRPSVRFKHAHPDTRELVTRMMPYYPKKCCIIAAFLDDHDQFWKVNYHWELLSIRVKKALTLKLGATSRVTLLTVQKSLEANTPKPNQGYSSSSKLGYPHDTSSAAIILARWHSMRDSKKKFREILDAENIAKLHPPAEGWDLAAAPVAAPGTSKHGSGYAFDIEGMGQNQLIASISKGLGATLVFDEKSHVHVEFKKGIDFCKHPIPHDVHDGRWAGWSHIA